MWVELRIWMDAIVFTVLESWDRYNVYKKTKEDHGRNMSIMLDMID